MNEFTRSFPLEDISIRAGGDGRTVEAYAAVFGQEVPISDGDGRYLERIDPSAFNRTLANKGTRFSVLYNHGMTIYGTPSDRGAMPIGTPLEVRADSRGLLTVTRYNRNALAEEALEAIREGAITAQSFAGSFVRSDKAKPRAGFRADAQGNLPLVTRQEINMREYGPTPFPAYSEASIVGVRATLSDTDNLLLSLILENLAEGDKALDPIVDALTKTDQALDQAQLVISQILGVPNPDDTDADERSLFLTRLDSLATRLANVPARSATPSDKGPGADDSPLRHSGRLLLSKRSKDILAATTLGVTS
ncbi:MAG: HK97 family phage prohead protease [Actinomycetales bacterium]